MKFLKGLLIALTLLAVAALGIGFGLPDQARVERSVLIGSPPATVYAVLNGFKQLNRWSPWADLDPETIYTYEGPPQGVGSRISWASINPNVGAGSQEILQLTPYREIKLRLDFKGMDADTVITYSLLSEGQSTRLNWTYQSSFGGNLVGRYLGLILDRMVGPDFDKGLARLKTLVESLPQDDFTPIQPELIQVQPKPIAYVSRDLILGQSDAGIADALTQINQFLQDSGRQQVDAPIVVTRSVDQQSGLWKADVGVPIDQACTAPSEEAALQCGQTYSGWAIRARSVPQTIAVERSRALLKIYQTVAGLDENGPTWQQAETTGAGSDAESPLLLYAPVK